MKLHLSILKSLIEIPAQDSKEVRKLLDDLGLEVKGIETNAGQTVYNIETLANRGDHLSALGIAREISARLLTALSFPKLSPEFSSLSSSIKLSVNTELCSRFALLEASLPKQFNLKSEITACLGHGLHPETPIVDLCNYLFLELGNSIHAFDADKVEGEMIIEILNGEESILALDGKEYKVPAGAIVGRDRKKIIIVSGVIGCANSMVGPNTKRVLIESAAFDPVSIRKTARAMGISTDASYSFERGVDREAILTGLRRLIALSSNVSEEGISPIAFTYYQGPKTESRQIALRYQEVRTQFNLPTLSETEILSRLKCLGYLAIPTDSKSSCLIQVPSWRLWDVEHEADLIEDLARAISFNQIEQKLPALDYAPPVTNSIEQIILSLETPLHGLGFREVMTKSLYSNDEVILLEQLDAESRNQHVAIKNALEKNCSHLKITNIISLAKLFQNNLKRGVLNFKVYETARLFRKKKEAGAGRHPYSNELDILSLGFGGRIRNGEFRKVGSTEESFYWFKGVVESCFANLGLNVEFHNSEMPVLHPGRQAQVSIANSGGRNSLNLGVFGQIHPRLASSLDISEAFFYAELDMFLVSTAWENKSSKISHLSDFPSAQRDLTLKVGKRVWASMVLEIVEQQNIKDLIKFSIVDDFRKENEDFRRVSYRFVFQSLERTLTASEVDSYMGTLQQALDQQGYALA